MACFKAVGKCTSRGFSHTTYLRRGASFSIFDRRICVCKSGTTTIESIGRRNFNKG